MPFSAIPPFLRRRFGSNAHLISSSMRSETGPLQKRIKPRCAPSTARSGPARPIARAGASAVRRKDAAKKRPRYESNSPHCAGAHSVVRVIDAGPLDLRVKRRPCRALKHQNCLLAVRRPSNVYSMVRSIDDETIADVLELNGRVAPTELLDRRTLTRANAVGLEQSLRPEDVELVLVYERGTDRSTRDPAPCSSVEVVDV